jgi:hypothetical protein
MSTISIKELSHPSGEVIKIASGKTLDLKSQGSTTLPTGSVLQVVHSQVTGGIVSSTTTNFADSGFNVTITPSSTSSKIHISWYFNANNNSSGATGTVSKVYRGTTAISQGNGTFDYQTVATNTHQTVCSFLLDSPATTSAVTYRLYFRKYGTGPAKIDPSWGGVRMTAMEIQG